MNMKRIAGLAAAAAMVAGTLAPLAAQTKTVTGEQSTITATVEAIDHGNRTVTLKGPKGNYVTIDVPANVTRFDSIKVGDKLTATYYENVVLNVQKPGEKPRDTAAGGRDEERFEQAWRDRVQAADDHRRDHGDRHESAVDLVQGTQRLGVQLEGAGQGRAVEGEGR